MNKNDPTAPRALRTILLAGTIAGALDIVAAMAVYGSLMGATPLQILQSVASGLLGREAYQGGLGAAALGLAAHFLISWVAAAIYLAASLRLRLLIRRPVPAGLAFGAAVYLFMSYVVLPLSAAAIAPPTPSRIMIGAALNMALFGLPIALVVSGRRR